MRRRDFIRGIAAFATSPLAARAQQRPGKIPQVGWLAVGSPAAQTLLDEYRSGMRELGYIEGRTVQTEYLYADGKIDRLPDLAAELVAHNVDVIVTAGTPGSLAAKRATTSTPIVFAASSDPLTTGVVPSLSRPGGNITGLSLMASDLSAKRLELIHTLITQASHIAVLWDNSNPGMALRVRETRVAAEQSKLDFYDAGVHDLEGLELMFSQLSQRRPDALLVTVEAFTNRHRDRIIEFATRNGIPAMYEESLFVEAGGLMSYGPSSRDLFRRSATYVDKILKGAKPADLPVEQPTKFDLVINLKTAKKLGLTIPQSLLVGADEVIE